MKHDKKRRILATIGIILLVLMYLTNLVLALIGTEWSRQALKGTMILSVAFPILLYAFLMLAKKNPGGREEELTWEEKQEIYRMIEEKEKAERSQDQLADKDSDAGAARDAE